MLQVLLWSDDAVQTATGKPPKFPQVERDYTIQANRHVFSHTLLHGANNPDTLPEIAEPRPDIWAVPQADDTPPSATGPARPAWNTT